MKSIQLSPTDQLFHDATHKVVVGYADVAALGASATGVIQLLPDTAKYTSATLPEGTEVALCKLELVTPFDFSDAGITSCLIEIGLTDGDTDAFLASTEMAADGSYVSYKSAASVTSRAMITTADTVDALITVANGGSPLCSECTSGEVHLYFNVTTPTLDNVKATDSLTVA